jgi:predicted kinase
MMRDATPTIHLVCGSTGAGKTTYSKQLSERIGAMDFSIDDWMVTLFAPDASPRLDWDWIVERTARCERQIMSTAVRLAKNGVSSVLDIGLLRASDRDRIATAAAGAGLASRLHFIDVDPTVRWKRIENRNARKGETFRLTVTRDMFNAVEKIWQPPNAVEMSKLNGVHVLEAAKG